jgi:four helix bundle protein
MTNDEFRMTNGGVDSVMGNGKLRSGRIYDLETRTAEFSERVIDFALEVERNPVTCRLISQLVAAATSVGANYCEADDAESRKDFRHKIGLWPQRGSRNEVLVSLNCTGSADVENIGPATLDGSKGTASDFFEDSQVV